MVTNMTSSNGGVTTHIVDMCRELCSRNIKTVLVSDENRSDYQKKIEELSKLPLFSFYSVDFSVLSQSSKSVFSVAKQVKKIAKAEKIDIIHSHSQSLCVVAEIVKLTTGIPFLWTNHIDEMANPQLFKKILRILKFPIISVSTDLKNMLVNDFGVSEKRITVVNNGIYTEDFTPLTEEEKEKLRKEYHCEGKYVIGLFSRLTYGKGHMFLLKSLKQLQEINKIADIEVLIAGKVNNQYEQDYLSSLLNYADKEHLCVKYIGFQKPRTFFGICDVYVLPSIYEGFPLTVLESLAMSCPVIRSDTPGWSDMKEFTLVFPKKNVNALVTHLKNVYEHRETFAECGRKGQKIVFDQFTIEKQVNQTVDVYKTITGK